MNPVEQGHSTDQLRNYMCFSQMNTPTVTSGPVGAQLRHISVTVRYAAAKQPFTDSKALVAETVGHLKARVLEHFKLHEASTPGQGKTYSLALGEELLTNLSATLGSLAGHKDHLKLSLIEQFSQG